MIDPYIIANIILSIIAIEIIYFKQIIFEEITDEDEYTHKKINSILLAASILLMSFLISMSMSISEQPTAQEVFHSHIIAYILAIGIYIFFKINIYIGRQIQKAIRK